MSRQPLRRVAEAQLGDGPLHGVQRVAPRGGQEALINTEQSASEADIVRINGDEIGVNFLLRREKEKKPARPRGAEHAH